MLRGQEGNRSVALVMHQRRKGFRAGRCAKVNQGPFKKESLELHTLLSFCFPPKRLMLYLEQKIIVWLTQNQRFNCTNLTLQLHKSIWNCTFCAELHAKVLL